MSIPSPVRLHFVYRGLEMGIPVEEINEITGIDQWFLTQISKISSAANEIRKCKWPISHDLLLKAKKLGFSDYSLAKHISKDEIDVRSRRKELGITPVFKRVDSCAAEFEAPTPYMYSTYADECESQPSDRKKVIILGSGPNRIGQGIEFDYCCVHASMALSELGIESIMINCNPETVSTDYDTSDRLYFEPLILERVLDIFDLEKPAGVILQFGGQTPLNLAHDLEKNKVPILGTKLESIDTAENREGFLDFCAKLDIKLPPSTVATNPQDLSSKVKELGYPSILRPSYVLGGYSMEVVESKKDVESYIERIVPRLGTEFSIQADRFLADAIEVDVDVLSDGEKQIVVGIMQHIEAAGIHSGDSACCLPPYSIESSVISEIKKIGRRVANELDVIGLLNIQMAVDKDNQIYVLEINPRASRTVPFVAKAIGLPIVKIATKLMLETTLSSLGLNKDPMIGHFAVKEAVFPFSKFNNTDTILGPEMKSTGEVMGLADNYEAAYAKAQEAAHNKIPLSGNIFVSVRNEDKVRILELCTKLTKLGFEIIATAGTAKYLAENGIPSQIVKKMIENGPNIGNRIVDGDVQMVINTTSGEQAILDSYTLRRLTLERKVPYFTTISAFNMIVNYLDLSKRRNDNILDIRALQEIESSY